MASRHSLKRAGRLVLLVLLPAFLGTASGSCVWSDCKNKASSLIGGCASGSSKKTTEDCGDKYFGIYTHEKIMCCPDADSCAWYDTDCNWPAVSDFFQNANDKVKAAWSALSEAVKDKLTTALKFATLDDAELLSLDIDLLAELKSVAGMTAHQLGVIKSKVQSMDKGQLTDFMKELSNSTLSEGMADLASDGLSWSQEQISVIKDKLVSSEAWGTASGWSATQIGSLRTMLADMDLTLIQDLADDALANAPNLANLSSTQIGGLGQKMFAMSQPLFSKMMQGLNGTSLSKGIASLNKVDRNWTSEQVSAFASKLLSPDAWGEAKKWTETKVSSLGAMLAALDVETIRSLSDLALANATNLAKLGAAQLGKLGSKIAGMNKTVVTMMLAGVNATTLAMSIKEMTGVDLAWTADQASAFKEKLTSTKAWGTVSNWTSENIGDMGTILTQIDVDALRSLRDAALANAPNLANLSSSQLGKLGQKLYSMSPALLTKMVQGLNGTSLSEGIASLNDVDRDWTTGQVSTFTSKLLSPEAWGEAKKWTETKVSSLGAMLAGVDVDTIKSLGDWALANATNLAKLGVTQLGKLGSKIAGMNKTVIISMLKGVNATNLAKSIKEMTGVDLAWTAEQASAFKDKLTSSEAWGKVSNWTSENIGSLGTILTQMGLDDLRAFVDSAFANATSLVKLSAYQLTGLGGKISSMSLVDLLSTISLADAQQVQLALLSQCEFQCEDETDAAFLRNPTSDNAAKAAAAYAARVQDKSAGAALGYANTFCSGDPTNMTEALAELDSAAVACNGSVKKKNALRENWSNWTKSQKSVLLETLTGAGALDSLSKWSQSQVSSLCNQYSSLSPSNIAEMAAVGLVSAAPGAAFDAVLNAYLGPYGGPVVSWGLSKAADQIEPQQRAEWARKLKDGLGESSSWSCTQAASLRTLAAGLDASDLAGLPKAAVKGLLPKAITAMEAAQVKGFTPDGLVAMTQTARKRVNGAKLKMLSSQQMVAAICGLADQTGAYQNANCPAGVVDLSIAFPDGTTPSAEAIYAHFSKDFPAAANYQVQVLSMLSDSERPLVAGQRRLAAASTEVTVRIGVSQHAEQAAGASTAQSAAKTLAGQFGGSLMDASTFVVLPATTTTTTTRTLVQMMVSHTGAKINMSLLVVVLVLINFMKM